MLYLCSFFFFSFLFQLVFRLLSFLPCKYFLKYSVIFDWTFRTFSFNLTSIPPLLKVRFSPFTQKENTVIQIIWAWKKNKSALSWMYRAFSSLRSKMVWPKSHTWNKGFWETGYFCCNIRVQCSKLWAACSDSMIYSCSSSVTNSTLTADDYSIKSFKVTEPCSINTIESSSSRV